MGVSERTAMPRNILIVDDNAELREILRLLLDLDGHSVRAAKDAAEAISLMGEGLADAIVIDDDPPDMSASHLAIHLKALAETMNPKPHFITVAIRGDFAPDELSVLEGFDHLLYKPVAYEHISALLAAPLPASK